MPAVQRRLYFQTDQREGLPAVAGATGLLLDFFD
jgi:hypothetical protein